MPVPNAVAMSACYSGVGVVGKNDWMTQGGVLMRYGCTGITGEHIVIIVLATDRCTVAL